MNYQHNLPLTRINTSLLSRKRPNYSQKKKLQNEINDLKAKLAECKKHQVDFSIIEALVSDITVLEDELGAME